jgi:hypothetical protein
MADIYEYEMAWVKPGQKVSITTPAYPDVSFTGTVSFIDPFLDTKTRTVKVRMDVPNPKLALKPGMFVDARLKVPYKTLRFWTRGFGRLFMLSPTKENTSRLKSPWAQEPAIMFLYCQG